MDRLPRLSGGQAVRALERLGFRVARQRESHVVLKKSIAGQEIGCVELLHRELAAGTLRGIPRQAGVTLEELFDKL